MISSMMKMKNFYKCFRYKKTMSWPRSRPPFSVLTMHISNAGECHASGPPCFKSCKRTFSDVINSNLSI